MKEYSGLFYHFKQILEKLREEQELTKEIQQKASELKKVMAEWKYGVLEQSYTKSALCVERRKPYLTHLPVKHGIILFAAFHAETISNQKN